jgi:hypothetical protein
MPTLAELQRSLQDFLLDKNADAETLTLETPQFARHERLHIYHNAYRLRLLDTLRSDFPAVEKLLGDATFENLCLDFIAAYPSNHPSLRWLGKDLPAFLRARQQPPQVCELAEFEWAQTMAFDAADDSVASIEDIRKLAPEAWMTMRLRFHSSVKLLQLISNAPEIWHGFIKHEPAVVITASMAAEPQTWLVWREDLQVVYRLLERPEASALHAFLSQQSFAEVCAELCSWLAEDEVPMQAARYLQQWLQAGLISEIC